MTQLKGLDPADVNAMFERLTAQARQELHDDGFAEDRIKAQRALDMTINAFSTGCLPLDQRSTAENLFWAICHKVRRLAQQQAHEQVPEVPHPQRGEH